MNVMGDKGQYPHPWQGQGNTMYNGYPPNPYNPYQQYNPQSYYYYQGGLPPYGGMHGQPAHQMMHPMKPFTPGGQLQSFSGNKELVAEKDQGQREKGTVDVECKKDLPPLPPGPPPSTANDQPSPPGSSPNNYYQPNNSGGGPVRFNMARAPRPQFNQQAVFNNSGSAKKKRKKNKKFNNQQQNQSFNSPSQNFVPPLPAHQMLGRVQPPLPAQAVSAPPLPPGPPPAAPLPPPDEIKPPVEPKPFSQKPRQMLDSQNMPNDWPTELQLYIRRCYAKSQSDVDKDRVSIILKGKIMRATNDGSLWTKDWTNEPLPMLESDLANFSLQPLNKVLKESSPTPVKKRLSSTLTNRLGVRLRSRSKSRSRSRSRSPIRPKQRSPRSRKRRDNKSNSSDSENDWMPIGPKKGKGRNFDRSFGKQGNKGKAKEKAQSHFYSEFGNLGDVPVNNELLEKRAARFNNSGRRSKTTKTGTTITITNTNASLGVFEDTTGDFELEDCHIVGVCQDIEKPYLRLTAAPEASAVRPPEVLRQSLTRVMQQWKQNLDYHYACEQLKSIRQDLTVQGIRDKLTVSVYETHARIALEKGDHAEFNQCQSQLKLLYDELPGENQCEFTAYRILYFIFTKENMDLNTEMRSLSVEDRKHECISHALNVRSAWALSNYHRLFVLYASAPRMSSCLMDWFLPRERKLALKTVIKAYRQTLPVSFLTKELAFQSDSLCQEFMSQYGVVYADVERTKIDCKTSATVVANV